MSNYYRFPEETFESQIKRAESAINRIESDEMRVWLSCILNALKMGKYARIQTTSGDFMDVSAIAYTTMFASFFDVYNHREKFNTSIRLVLVEELQFTIRYNI